MEEIQYSSCLKWISGNFLNRFLVKSVKFKEFSSRVDKGRIVQIANSLPNYAHMSPTISRFDLEVVPKISRP